MLSSVPRDGPVVTALLIAHSRLFPSEKRSFYYIDGNNRRCQQLGFCKPSPPLYSSRSRLPATFIAATHSLCCRIGMRDCLIPGFDSAFLSGERSDALWTRFSTGAPQRSIQSVEQYKIAKRA